MQQSNAAYFSQVVRALRSRVSRYAYYGLAIASFAVLMATITTVALSGEPVTLSTLYAAQRGNASLLALDFMPFLFAMWGQYVGVIMSHQAGAMVLDQTERLRIDKHALEAEAVRLGQRDALTGLCNRAYFIDQLESGIAAAHLSRTRLGLIVVDLDGFSEVNDHYGAANGDRVLKSVARRLGNAIGDAGLVARLGGDSFGVLLDPLQSTDILENAARRIQQGLEPPCALESLALNLAASIGGAVYPDNARDTYALINAAEGAMQHAKTRGGGFELVKARMPLRDAEMHSLSAELRTAIEKDQLILHLQPLVDTVADRVHGVEALVRWQHPRRGLIMPGDFIPRAERSGLMRDLSNWVLRRALEYAADLRANGWPLRMSVNLSARSLLDPDFPDVLAGLLAAYELPSKFLTLEITEDTLMADQRRTLDVITRVANMGVQISIDDFGTGYSQLAYLKRLPASEIKIDRSFVQDMLISKTDLSIVQATIGLGHALGLRAVGEGIETEAQADRMRLLGCDLIQGFYIGRPMPIDKLREWLDQWYLHHTPEQDRWLG
ncbi:putative bifunctional diguanylate cyclase/phosphodiesterase [Salinisphaera aquimarina]|uniref:Bifunctional diguanylate cyclase/phosphodiesterase n=1 Tax=Salinisphaera aquimarina TaxID=2094031 RepID=A0ABV7ESR2_9GAMM